VSRASFELAGGDTTADRYDTDRGGAIEVWPDAAGARRRADYLRSIRGGILGTEYNYLAGPVLARVAGKVKPSVAAKFEAAVAALAA
jgi:hypothetical protein